MSSQSFTQRMTGRVVKYVEPVARGNATGLVADVYGQAEREFDLVPPLTLHSPVPKILAAFWVLARESYVVGRAGRADREIVAAAVSQTNACPFCVEIHSAMLHATTNHKIAGALLDAASAAQSNDPLVQWALATRNPGAKLLSDPPFRSEKSPQILATAILYHYLNRMVNVFLEASPSPVKLRSHRVKNLVGRLLGAVIGRRIVSVDARPGLSLALLPVAPLPEEFTWARPDPSVAGALARFSATIEEQSVEIIPAAARRSVEDAVQHWQGEDPGLSSQWIDVALAGLTSEADRAIARLALQTALASYRVDAAAIAKFRAHRPKAGELIATTAWASLKAVQRIATWIAPSRGAAVELVTETPRLVTRGAA